MFFFHFFPSFFLERQRDAVGRKVRRRRVGKVRKQVVQRRRARLRAVLRREAEARHHREAPVLDLALLHDLEDGRIGREVERVKRAARVAVLARALERLLEPEERARLGLRTGLLEVLEPLDLDKVVEDELGHEQRRERDRAGRLDVGLAGVVPGRDPGAGLGRGVGEDDRRGRGHGGAPVDELSLDHPAERLGLGAEHQRVEAVVAGERAVEVGGDLASREPVLARGGAGRDRALKVFFFKRKTEKEMGELWLLYFLYFFGRGARARSFSFYSSPPRRGRENEERERKEEKERSQKKQEERLGVELGKRKAEIGKERIKNDSAFFPLSLAPLVFLCSNSALVASWLASCSDRHREGLEKATGERRERLRSFSRRANWTSSTLFFQGRRRRKSKESSLTLSPRAVLPRRAFDAHSHLLGGRDANAADRGREGRGHCFASFFSEARERAREKGDCEREQKEEKKKG